MTKVYPVIMCGGSGTRLWPLSRRKKPKQYHSLVGENSLLQETVSRLKGTNSSQIMSPSFICAKDQGELIKAQCKVANIAIHRIILEPIGRNTAPVAAIAANLIAQDDPDSAVLLLPADHHIEDAVEFWNCIQKGLPAAQQGYLTTLGIQANRPETGFGYIRRGAELKDNVYKVEQFVEKPDQNTAQTYLDDGNYFWNAGIFLFKAQTMLEAFKSHAPDILDVSVKAAQNGVTTDGQLLLDKEMFSQCRSESIDYAIMEHAEKVAVVAPVDIGWNDIGSWNAVAALNAKKAPENAIVIDCNDTFISSDKIKVAALGLDNIIIVATEDAILVTTPDRAQDIKQIVEALKESDDTNYL